MTSIARPLLVGLGIASVMCATAASQAPAAGVRGRWLVTLTPPDRGELVVRMTFEQRSTSFTAYSRPGGLRPMTTWRAWTLGRLFGKLPSHGAVVVINDGVLRAQGDSTIVTGRLESPFLGRFYVAGSLRNAHLRAELRRDSLGVSVGGLDAVQSSDTAPVRDYLALHRNMQRAVADSIYDPTLLARPEWQRFFTELERRFRAARDDADVLLAFYDLRRGLGLSHLVLIRDPKLAATSLDSLLARGGSATSAYVTTTFPAPGIAYMRVTRWDRVADAVHRAFASVDSARARTLILDIRGNPGGDASSIAPLTHLIRDTIPAGVFVGHKWHTVHRGAPVGADLRDLPVLSREDGASVIHAIREHGAVVGRAPPREPYFAGRVWLLIDGRTGSASEPLAYLLRQKGLGTLVGERTAGAMLSAPPHSVGQGWVFILPEGDYYTPEGTRIEGVGVSPHVAVASAEALLAVADSIRREDVYASDVLRGMAHFDARRWKNAERSYRDALRRRPDGAAPTLGLARTLQEQQRWDEAFTLLGQFLVSHPDDMAATYQVGRVAAITGRSLDRGESALRTYLNRTPPPGQPSHAAAHWRLGMILEALNRIDEAREQYEAALRLEPDQSEAKAALRSLSARSPAPRPRVQP